MQIQAETGKEMEMDDMVYGFVKIANETMARPIRTLTEARGFATSKHMYVVISPAHEIAWLMR
jgi:5-oxoprolinase (ATP-hydrolysing)